jgi:hypothetical protein
MQHAIAKGIQTAKRGLLLKAAAASPMISRAIPRRPATPKTRHVRRDFSNFMIRVSIFIKQIEKTLAEAKARTFKEEFAVDAFANYYLLPFIRNEGNFLM